MQKKWMNIAKKDVDTTKLSAIIWSLTIHLGSRRKEILLEIRQKNLAIFLINWSGYVQ